jgi:hypothetical protein
MNLVSTPDGRIINLITSHTQSAWANWVLHFSGASKAAQADHQTARRRKAGLAYLAENARRKSKRFSRRAIRSGREDRNQSAPNYGEQANRAH